MLAIIVGDTTKKSSDIYTSDRSAFRLICYAKKSLVYYSPNLECKLQSFFYLN
jgi:hypothetical protein